MLLNRIKKRLSLFPPWRNEDKISEDKEREPALCFHSPSNSITRRKVVFSFQYISILRPPLDEEGRVIQLSDLYSTSANSTSEWRQVRTELKSFCFLPTKSVTHKEKVETDIRVPKLTESNMDLDSSGGGKKVKGWVFLLGRKVSWIIMRLCGHDIISWDSQSKWILCLTVLHKSGYYTSVNFKARHPFHFHSLSPFLLSFQQM